MNVQLVNIFGTWGRGLCPQFRFMATPFIGGLKFILNRSNLPSEFQDEWPLMMLAVTITLDTIWSTRNKIDHEQVESDVREKLRSIQRRYYAHCEAWQTHVH